MHILPHPSTGVQAIVHALAQTATLGSNGHNEHTPRHIRGRRGTRYPRPDSRQHAGKGNSFRARGFVTDRGLPCGDRCRGASHGLVNNRTKPLACPPPQPRRRLGRDRVATIVAALIRLPGLDNVRTLVFDETYYVKDAWSLLTLGYEGTWPNNYDASFVAGNVSGLSAAGGYPVHPPTGKWIIAIGMKIFGQTDPVGWRITTAICGIITVFLLCRITQNLFRSPALTLLAGLFLATDGIAIVMSRTSILDGFLAMFALAAFFCFVKDQQMSRPMLAHRLTAWDGIGAPRGGWHDLGEFLRGRDRRGFMVGPNAGRRPWLLAAGILCGLASSVKWSGIYVLACLGLFVAIREVTYRWRLGHPSPIRGALIADVWWAFILMVPSAILTYIASWIGWFMHPQAHGHGRSGIPASPAHSPTYGCTTRKCGRSTPA